MAQNDRPTPPQNRANFAANRNPANPAPTAPPPPSATQRGAAPNDQQANPAGSTQQQAQRNQGSKQRVFFRSSQPSTNLYPDTVGGNPIRFRDHSFSTDDPVAIEFLRKNFVGRASGPLRIEEISESDAKQAQERRDEDAPLREQGILRTNNDGVSIVEPSITAIPQQNMMVYPQPPLNQPVPTPGPHIAAETSMDPADEGGVRRVTNPVTTQLNPGADEESTLRPQDHPNVPAEMKEEPDIEPAPRPAGASVEAPEKK